MYTLKVRYGAITSFLSALQSGSAMTEMLTSTLLSPEVLASAQSPEMDRVLAGKGMSREQLNSATTALRKGDQRTTKALAPFRTALAHAGIFPEGHIMATAEDQAIEIVVDAEATRELFSVAASTAYMLRTLAAGPPKDLLNPEAPRFPLEFLFKVPSDQLAAAAPEVLRAALDAGAPIF